MRLRHLIEPLGVITIGKVMEPVIIDHLHSHYSWLTGVEAQMFSCVLACPKNGQCWGSSEHSGLGDSGRVIVEDWNGLVRSEGKLGPFSFVRGS